MLIRFCIKFIVCLLTIKFAFAEIVDVNNEQIKELLKNNIPIVDIRRSSEWDQTGVVPKSILLTFFDKEGNYNYDEWYEKLRLEIDEGKPIILICRTGRRTKIIAKMMEIKKFDNIIYNAKSGITSWIDEKPFVLLVVGFPKLNAKVPKFASQKKSLSQISTWFK